MSNPSLSKIANEIFNIEQKLKKRERLSGLERNFDKIYRLFIEEDLHLYNPIGEYYDDTRLDCEATISSDTTHDLVIKEVIKPIIYKEVNGSKTISQKAIVIVATK